MTEGASGKAADLTPGVARKGELLIAIPRIVPRAACPQTGALASCWWRRGFGWSLIRCVPVIAALPPPCPSEGNPRQLMWGASDLAFSAVEPADASYDLSDNRSSWSTGPPIS